MNHIIELIDLFSYWILILIIVVVLELIIIAIIRRFIDRNGRP